MEEENNIDQTTTTALRLTDSELTRFHELNNTINMGVAQLGDIELVLSEKELQKKSLIDQIRNLAAQRQELVKTFSDKYGSASINIETGEITPV